jgi:hypothetical protein
MWAHNSATLHPKVNAQTIFEDDGKHNWSGEKIRSQTCIIERVRWIALAGSNINIPEGDIMNIIKRYGKF